MLRRRDGSRVGSGNAAPLVGAWLLTLAACAGSDATPSGTETTDGTPDAASPAQPDAGASSEQPPAPDAGAGAIEPTFDCTALPGAPLELETPFAATSSEDFLFDALGNYVGVDQNDSLIRLSSTGVWQFWALAVGIQTPGMALLADGSLLLTESSEGALKRIAPNGTVSVLLGGLSGPNGVAVGPDGFAYVAEQDSGRVRRVDPASGAFSVIAMGLDSPNGVAFDGEGKQLYVTSFSGSGVYVIELGAAGALGRASVFARPNGSSLREPLLACPEQVVGSDCTSRTSMRGQCQTLANVVDCVPADPCPDLLEGGACDYPISGTCQGGLCLPRPAPCQGASDGDVCSNGIYRGVCVPNGTDLTCELRPCYELAEGAPCEDPVASNGVCELVAGELSCQSKSACFEKALGDLCEDPFFDRGVCSEQSNIDGLICLEVSPCFGLDSGAACTSGGWPGTCQGNGDPLSCILRASCEGLSDGDPCEDRETGAGVCRSNGDQLYCAPGPACLSAPGARACGIDGVAVDACGNVYVTESLHGYVWRISPAGAIELLADLDAPSIPNLRWGGGIGGFASDVLFVNDPNTSRLFALRVGVPGARAFH